MLVIIPVGFERKGVSYHGGGMFSPRYFGLTGLFDPQMVGTPIGLSSVLTTIIPVSDMICTVGFTVVREKALYLV